MSMTIYTKPGCGYCVSAKALLDRKGIPFREIDVLANLEARQEMIRRAGGRMTVPQIFAGARHLGGCTDLYDLESGGTLDSIASDLRVEAECRSPG